MAPGVRSKEVTFTHNLKGVEENIHVLNVHVGAKELGIMCILYSRETSARVLIWQILSKF